MTPNRTTGSLRSSLTFVGIAGCDLLALGGLSAAEIAALAAARGGIVLVPDLFAMTEGNPFYVEELVRHVAESGDVTLAEGLPDSVRDTIARRLLRLPEPTRRRSWGWRRSDGGTFCLDVVARAAAVDVDAADDALDPGPAGWDRQRASPAGGHVRLHPCAHPRRPARRPRQRRRRARVHRRFGEALVEVDGDPGEVARHLLAAAEDGSDVGPGVEAALVAAGEAVERYTYDDAVAVLEPAWAAVTGRSGGLGLVCRVAITLATTLRRSGEYEQRTGVLEQAWERAGAAGSADLLADVIVEGCAATSCPGSRGPRGPKSVRRTTRTSRPLAGCC